MKLVICAAVFVIIWGLASSIPPICIDGKCETPARGDPSIHLPVNIDSHEVKNNSKRSVISNIASTLKNSTKYVGRKLHIINKRQASELVAQQDKECPKCKARGEVDANTVEGKRRSEREIKVDISTPNLTTSDSNQSATSLSNKTKRSLQAEKNMTATYLYQPQIFSNMENETQGSEEIIRTKRETAAEQVDDLKNKTKRELNQIQNITINDVTIKPELLIEEKTTKGPLQVGESETRQAPKVTEDNKNNTINSQNTIKQKAPDGKRSSRVKRNIKTEEDKEIENTKDIDSLKGKTVKEVKEAPDAAQEKNKTIMNFQETVGEVNGDTKKSDEKKTIELLQVGESKLSEAPKVRVNVKNTTNNPKNTIKEEGIDVKGSHRVNRDTAIKEANSQHILSKRDTSALVDTKINSKNNFSTKAPHIGSQMATGRKLLTVFTAKDDGSKQNATDNVKNITNNPGNTIKVKGIDVKASRRVKRDTAIREAKEVKETKKDTLTSDIVKSVSNESTNKDNSQHIHSKRDTNALVDTKENSNNNFSTKAAQIGSQIATGRKLLTVLRAKDDPRKQNVADNVKNITKSPEHTIKEKGIDFKESYRVKRDTAIKKAKKVEDTKKDTITTDTVKSVSNESTNKDNSQHIHSKRDTSALADTKENSKNNFSTKAPHIGSQMVTGRKLLTALTAKDEGSKQNVTDDVKNITNNPENTIEEKGIDAKESHRVKRDTAIKEDKEVKDTKKDTLTSNIVKSVSNESKNKDHSQHIASKRDTSTLVDTKVNSNNNFSIKAPHIGSQMATGRKLLTTLTAKDDGSKQNVTDHVKNITNNPENTIKEKGIDVKESHRVKRDTAIKEAKEVKITKKDTINSDIVKSISNESTNKDNQHIRSIRDTSALMNGKVNSNNNISTKAPQIGSQMTTGRKLLTVLTDKDYESKENAIDNVKNIMNNPENTIKGKGIDVKGSHKVKRDIVTKEAKEVKETKTIDRSKDASNKSKDNSETSGEEVKESIKANSNPKGLSEKLAEFTSVKREVTEEPAEKNIIREKESEISEDKINDSKVSISENTKIDKDVKTYSLKVITDTLTANFVKLVTKEDKNKDIPQQIRSKRDTSALMDTEVLSNNNFSTQAPQIGSQIATGRKLLTVLTDEDDESERHSNTPKTSTRDLSLHMIDINGAQSYFEANNLENNKSLIDHIRCACAFFLDGPDHQPIISEFLLEPIKLHNAVSSEEMLCSKVCSKISDIYFKQTKDVLCTQIKDFHHKLQAIMPIKHTSKEDDGKDTIFCQILPKQTETPPWEYIISYMHVIFVDVLVCMTSIGLVCLYLICFIGHKRDSLESRLSIPLYTRSSTATFTLKK